MRSDACKPSKKRAGHLLTGRTLPLAVTLFMAVLFLLLSVCPKTHILWILLPLCLTVGSLLLLLFLSLRRSDRARTLRRRLFPLCLCFFALLLAGMSAFRVLIRREKQYDCHQNATEHIVFCVADVTETPIISRITGKALTVGGAEEAITFSFYAAECGLYEIGDIYAGEATLSLTETKHLWSQKTELLEMPAWEADFRKPPEPAEGSVPLSVRLTQFRNRSGLFLTERVPSTSAGLMKALLFADKSDLSPTLRSQFADLGVSHLLAVSGMHLSILIGFLSVIADRLSLGKRAASLLLTAVTLGYIALTGFSPSMLRAGGMVLLLYLSRLVRRRRDSLTSLFAALFLILLISPESALDPALLLSFSSCLGILLLAQPILRIYARRRKKSRFRLWRALSSFVVTSFVITASATTLSLPVLSLMEGRLFLLSLFTNLLIAPLFTLLLVLLVLVLALWPIEFLSGTAAWLFDLVARFLFFAIDKLSCLSFANLSLSYPFIPFLMLAAGVTLLLLFRFGKHPVLLLFPLSFFILAAPIGARISQALVEKEGQLAAVGNETGDALLLAQGRHCLLISCTDTPSFTTSALSSVRDLHPALTVEALVLTGGSISAVARMDDWVKEGVKILFYPVNKSNSPDIAIAARRAGITVLLYTPGDCLQWRGITLATHADAFGRKSSSVAAFDFTVGGRSVLYLKENASDHYDIRFGVMQKPHTVLIKGTFGKAPQAPCPALYENRAEEAIVLAPAGDNTPAPIYRFTYSLSDFPSASGTDQLPQEVSP